MNWEYFSALSIPYCARKILRMQNFAPEKNDVSVSSTSPTVKAVGGLALQSGLGPSSTIILHPAPAPAPAPASVSVSSADSCSWNGVLKWASLTFRLSSWCL